MKVIVEGMHVDDTADQSKPDEQPKPVARHRKDAKVDTDPSLYKQVDFDRLLADKPDAKTGSQVAQALKKFAEHVPTRRAEQIRAIVEFVFVIAFVLGIIGWGIWSALEILSRTTDKPW